MLQSARLLAAQKAGRRFVVLKPAAAPMDWYGPVEAARAQGLDLRVFEGRDQDQAYEARAGFDAAMVASGTATLKTALLGTPFCILYRLNALSYAIGKRLVKIHSIGLANVVAGSRIVPEFLQQGLDPRAIAAAMEGLLSDPKARALQRKGLAPGLRSLGGKGVAARVAGELLKLAREARAA
jgi:lipid-A-disaccharide synthase